MEQELSLYTHHLVYGALGLIALLLGIYGHIYRLWVQPAKTREKEQNDRLKDIEKEQALQAQRLESGDRKFTDMCENIKGMRNDIGEMKVGIAKLNTLFQNAIFKGIGEPS